MGSDSTQLPTGSDLNVFMTTLGVSEKVLLLNVHYEYLLKTSAKITRFFPHLHLFYNF